MLKNYKVGIVKGDDRNIGQLLGWFAMSREVSKEMDGYPILTDKDTTWFVAHMKLDVIGFGAIKWMKSHAILTYSYVVPEFRKKGIHKRLLDDRIAHIVSKGMKLVKADCTKASLGNFKRLGFTVSKEFRNWTKVEKEL